MARLGAADSSVMVLRCCVVAFVLASVAAATVERSAGGDENTAAENGRTRIMAWFVTVLAVAVGSLFWLLAGHGLVSSGRADLEYWEHRRRRIVATIAELLSLPGRRPASKLFAAIYDEFEGVLVTERPISVPKRHARITEIVAVLSESLQCELREAFSRRDTTEVERLYGLGNKVQKALKQDHSDLLPTFSDELIRASDFLKDEKRASRQQILRLFQFVDREVSTWLVIGLVIKVLSQIPSPMRMIYVSATITAASKGSEGLEEFSSAMKMSLLLFAVEKLMQFAGRITMFHGEQLFTLRLKKEVYAACLRQDMKFFDSHKCGELQNRLHLDTAEVCNKVLYFPVRFIQFLFFMLFSISVLMVRSPRLVLATLSVLPLSMFGNLVLAKRVQRYYGKIQKRADASACKTQEVLANIRIVRSFAREPYELRQYLHDQEYEARINTTVNVLQSMMAPLFHSLSELSFFVGLYYGGLLITQGLLEPGEVITLVQGTQACNAPLNDLFDVLPQIAKAAKPAGRICDLLERPQSIERLFTSADAEAVLDASMADASPGSPSRDAGVALEFEDVFFSFPSRPEVGVLRGLSFEAAPGEVVGLVGPTGCGKSTVMSLLMRFYQPDRGQISFDRRRLEDYDPYWLRRQIAIVAQEPLLFGTSLRENLLYGAAPAQARAWAGDDAKLQEACELAHAWEFVQQMPEGLSTEVGERGVQLSGGQKQRIAIARAIIRRPKVLLLDEATSALDVESEKVVQQALDEVVRASACTTIVIAHRLSTIQNVDKIVVMKDGAVGEQGAPRELAERPGGLYQRLLRLSAKHEDREAVPSAAKRRKLAEDASPCSIDSHDAEPERRSPADVLQASMQVIEDALQRHGLCSNGSRASIGGALDDVQQVVALLKAAKSDEQPCKE
eukprot:TRINITY_DN65983_c0_g1_i1.p1 TRINITY_DN65983_c0_g1~~TRINITY_DN65983_c0_g1_i1.p1  ORF type:complete len:904 (+),score=227.08 TRINITY_DN65983_c0_g1_i1:69-2780(+)